MRLMVTQLIEYLDSYMCVLQSKTPLKGMADKACSLVLNTMDRKTPTNELLRVPAGTNVRRRLNVYHVIPCIDPSFSTKGQRPRPHPADKEFLRQKCMH